MLKIEKTLDNLPVVLAGNTIYLLKTAGKLKIFVTNLSGSEIYEAGLYQPLIKIKNLNTDYTVLLEDAFETLLRLNGVSPLSVTVPLDTADIPIGACILISNNTTSTVTIAPEAGLTINTPTSLVIDKQFGKITLIKVAANEWDAEGNFSTV